MSACMRPSSKYSCPLFFFFCYVIYKIKVGKRRYCSFQWVGEKSELLIIVQIIYFLVGLILSQFVNGAPLKPVLWGVGSVATLHYCT